MATITNIALLEHININAPAPHGDTVTAFYIDALGCHDDARVDEMGKRNRLLWANLGCQQFHLPYINADNTVDNAPQLIRGTMGIIVRDVAASWNRLQTACEKHAVLHAVKAEKVPDTVWPEAGRQAIAVTCPFGNRFLLHELPVQYMDSLFVGAPNSCRGQPGCTSSGPTTTGRDGGAAGPDHAAAPTATATDSCPQAARNLVGIAYVRMDIPAGAAEGLAAFWGTVVGGQVEITTVPPATAVPGHTAVALPTLPDATASGHATQAGVEVPSSAAAQLLKRVRVLAGQPGGHAPSTGGGAGTGSGAAHSAATDGQAQPPFLAQWLDFEETHDPVPAWDGHHLALYLQDFQGPYRRCEAAGLIYDPGRFADRGGSWELAQQYQQFRVVHVPPPGQALQFGLLQKLPEGCAAGPVQGLIASHPGVEASESQATGSANQSQAMQQPVLPVYSLELEVRCLGHPANPL